MHKLSAVISVESTNAMEPSLQLYFVILKRINAIQSDVYVPEESRTVKVLLDLLAETPTNNGHKCSEGEALRVALLMEMMPWLEKSLGSSQ